MVDNYEALYNQRYTLDRAFLQDIFIFTDEQYQYFETTLFDELSEVI